MCDKAGNGRCATVKEAYDESVADTGNIDIVNPSENNIKDIKNIRQPENIKQNIYKQALYKRLTSLLREPETPFVVPPAVQRALIVPYRGSENELYMPRFVYFFTDDPKWVLGDYLMGDDTQ